MIDAYLLKTFNHQLDRGNIVPFEEYLKRMFILLIDDEGNKNVVQLFYKLEALKNNKSVKKLKISYIDFDNECIINFNLMIRINQFIKELFLEGISHFDLLADSLRNNTYITKLYLSLNFSSSQIKSLALLLTDNNTINDLTLSFLNSIDGTILSDAFSQTHAIFKNIRLHNIRRVKHLINALTNHPIEKLALSSNGMKQSALTSLSNFLKNHSSLTHLDIIDFAFDDEAVFIKMLCSHSYFKILNLSIMTSFSSQNLKTLLTQHPNLITLKLNNIQIYNQNNLNDYLDYNHTCLNTLEINRGLNSDINFLLQLQSLNSLTLTYNSANDEQWCNIIKYLTHMPLTQLDLSNNLIHTLGLNSLGELLTLNRLVELNLNYNMQAGETDFSNFSDGLSNNTSLRVLALSNCGLTNIDLEVLSTGLKKNSTLTSLNLRNNSLKDSIGELFHEIIQFNKSLNYLDLGSIKISSKEIDCIIKAARYPSNLQTFLFYDFTITPKYKISKNILGSSLLKIRDDDSKQSILAKGIMKNIFAWGFFLSEMSQDSQVFLPKDIVKIFMNYFTSCLEQQGQFLMGYVTELRLEKYPSYKEKINLVHQINKKELAIKCINIEIQKLNKIISNYNLTCRFLASINVKFVKELELHEKDIIQENQKLKEKLVSLENNENLLLFSQHNKRGGETAQTDDDIRPYKKPKHDL